MRIYVDRDPQASLPQVRVSKNSGDTTPCRMTGVALHSPVILHGVVSPEQREIDLACAVKLPTKTENETVDGAGTKTSPLTIFFPAANFSAHRSIYVIMWSENLLFVPSLAQKWRLRQGFGSFQCMGPALLAKFISKRCE